MLDIDLRLMLYADALGSPLSYHLPSTTYQPPATHLQPPTSHLPPPTPTAQLLLAGNGETVVRLRYRAAVHPPVSLAPPAAVVRTVGAVGAVDGVAAEATAIAADLLEYSGGIVNGRWQGIGEVFLT